MQEPNGRYRNADVTSGRRDAATPIGVGAALLVAGRCLAGAGCSIQVSVCHADMRSRQGLRLCVITAEESRRSNHQDQAQDQAAISGRAGRSGPLAVFAGKSQTGAHLLLSLVTSILSWHNSVNWERSICPRSNCAQCGSARPVERCVRQAVHGGHAGHLCLSRLSLDHSSPDLPQDKPRQLPCARLQ